MNKFNKRLLIATAILSASLALTGCAMASQSSATASQTASNTASDFFTTDAVHGISVDFNDADYQAMLTEYANSGDKTWLKATVTIDGTTFKNVGIKLKGNSTLRGLSTSAKKTTDPTTDQADDTTTTASLDTATTADVPTGEPSTLDSASPETLPWVIRLDKYDDDVSYQGRSYFVVRANNTETSLNEAVALAVLNEAGVEAEKAAFTRFSVNGSEENLRLVLDVPDDDLWTEDHFDGSGLLYKADGNGDYSYRGTDPAEYAEAFEQKYGEDDLTPLISFLEFINNSTDEDFASTLSEYLDTEAFATYLASQELIQNTDDIDGPGNNSYLYYDSQTKQMTVVAWDHNLAYGGMGGNRAGGPGGNDGEMNGQRPTGIKDMENKTPPDGMETPPDLTGEDRPELPMGDNATEAGTERTGKAGLAMGGGGKENVLVTRFLANDTFNRLYETKVAALKTQVIDSQFGSDTLKAYQDLLTTNVSDLIDPNTIASEADAISKMLSNTQPTDTSDKN